jgi:hypothetical protein
VVPGIYQVALTWQWAPYNRATNAKFTINGGAPITVNQMIAPSADQLGEGVTSANGTIFQVLRSDVEVLADSDTIQVQVTDDANSYVTLDAVMVRVVSVTSVPSPFPLTAAGGALPQSAGAEPLTAEDLSPLVAAAIAQWSEAGVDGARLESLRSAEVRIADLPDATLGLAFESEHTILIDVDAAGYGWFVDTTPGAAEEFALAGADGRLATVRGDAADHIDLLTVLAHELGHLLGREDLDPLHHAHDLMAATLGTGVRRLAGAEFDAPSAPADMEYASTAASQAETAPGATRARHDIFARVDGWLESDLVELFDGGPDDDSDEAGQDARQWWALYGQE